MIRIELLYNSTFDYVPIEWQKIPLSRTKYNRAIVLQYVIWYFEGRGYQVRYTPHL